MWLALQRARVGRPGATERELLADLAPGAALAGGACARAERDAARLARLGGDVVARLDPDYPAALAALADAPSVLLVRGVRSALAGPALSIVGARAATRAARRRARELGRDLAAKGFTIVSGLARGIDAEAHRGALEAGGVTVAVLAGGLDRLYPPEHRALADEIADRGAILSEMPLGTPPRRELFPQRNRLISGLSLGVLVVEARERSGSLITVRHALAQGREVFVVPGSVDGPFARGNHRLLRDGARPIATADEVVEDLVAFDGALARALERAVEAARPAPLPRAEAGPDGIPAGRQTGAAGALERSVLEALRDGPLDLEALAVATGIAAGPLAAVVLDLTMAARIVEERDGRLARSNVRVPSPS